MNVFTVTFNQFNASLLNKNIHLKIILLMNFWMVVYSIVLKPYNNNKN